MSRRLVTLLPVALLAAAVGCQPPQAPPAVAPALPTQPANPNAPSAYRTLEYWEGISRAQYFAAGQFAGYDNPKLEDVTKLLVAVAKGVEELPAVGVDPDAIEAAHGVAESMRRLTRFLGQSLSAANGVQATIRLLFGDNGAFKELSADTRDLRNFIEESAAKARKTRAVLSSRYGREFPALDAPPKKPAGPNPAQQLLATYQLFRDLEQPTAAQELTRLKAEIADMGRQEDSIKNGLAKEIAACEKLDKQTMAMEAANADEKKNLLAFAESVKDAEANNTKVPVGTSKVQMDVDQAKKKLAADTNAYQKRATTLASLQTALQTREESKKVLFDQLNQIQSQRRELQAAADEVEVVLRLLDPSKLRPVDDTKLTELREQIEKLNKKLDVEREKLQLIDPPAKK